MDEQVAIRRASLSFSVNLFYIVLVLWWQVFVRPGRTSESIRSTHTHTHTHTPPLLPLDKKKVGGSLWCVLLSFRIEFTCVMYAFLLRRGPGAEGTQNVLAFFLFWSCVLFSSLFFALYSLSVGTPLAFLVALHSLSFAKRRQSPAGAVIRGGYSLSLSFSISFRLCDSTC